MSARIRRLAVTPICTVAVTLLLGATGCGSTDQGGVGDTRLTVVTSTDVWGSVARAVAGDGVEVKSIIKDPSADPHSYEVKPAEVAEVADADLVVYNGGGYDGFIETILQQVGDKPAIEAYSLEPHKPTNEHVWYDLPVVQEVAQQIAEKLGRLDSGQAQQFAARAQTFRTELDGLQATLAGIARAHSGQRVAMTEPVAQYLITAAGLTDATPPDFLEAVEEETDPPAAAVAATKELFAQQQVRTLVYNPQAETPVTAGIRAASEAARIPVVTMTETLPENTDYRGWMSGQIDALSAALQGRP
ncbi:MAG TPA: zinc ABC transporter substrate-binding protein [Pseudonocardiaceae bacterium]|nr:zinc ABC transporter substrate-binding protein [Pseudonocardiaceae bacterium]